MQNIPETVILDMQGQAYARKRALPSLRMEVETAERKLQIAKNELALAESQLGEIADFLQEYNADALNADETWQERLLT